MTPAALPAALLVATAVTLLLGRPAAVLPSPPGRRGSGAGPLLLAAAAVAVVLSARVPLRWLALGAIALAVVAGARRRSRHARDAAAAARTRQHVVDFTEALCGELAAGQPVARAVERAVVAWPDAAPVARAARLGADVPEALRALARSPGAEGVARLAAAWQLSASSGAGLAQASRRVLETARTRQAAERLVLAEVASARATARLVCALPVVVLLAAQGAGARPWAFLTGHPAGLVCLAGGLALSWAGLTWIDRIAASAVEGAG